MEESPAIRAKMEQFFASLARGDASWPRANVAFDRSTLVVGTDAQAWWEDGGEVEIRVTQVRRRRDGDWKLTLGHGSIGTPNEDAFGQELTTE